MPQTLSSFDPHTDAAALTNPGREAPQSAVKQVLRAERLPCDLEETRAALTELARRKCGHIPPELLVEQVVAATENTDWPTRRAAMEAILRRIGFAERDGLSVAQRPPNGRVLGLYRLRGHRVDAKGTRRAVTSPYYVELDRLEPLSASCDCADYLRGSLGLCKHLLAVLEDVASSPRRSAAARAEAPNTRRANRPVLRWNPVRDFCGPGDRLAALTLDTTALRPSSAPRSAAHPMTLLGPTFRKGAPIPAILASPARRRDLLTSLSRAMLAGKLEAESAARALVAEELASAERRVEALKAARPMLSHLKSLARRLYPYQLDGVRRFLETRRLLLADDMGLGKTTQAIAIGHVLFRAGAIERGLVIVPASLKSQWIREWQATSDVPIQAVDGRPDERRRLYAGTRRGFLVMNYEQLLRDLEAVHRFAPELVVLDEAQRIKNWATKSSVYVKTLSPEWRLVLTGTPMENRLEELASLLDWVDDVALTPKWRLVPWHTTFGGHGRSERTGARNLDTLRSRLAPCMVRRVRKDVLAQLPSRTDTRVPVEMTEQQRAEHDELSLPIAQLVKRGQKRPLSQAEFLKLMQLLATQRIISNGLAQLRFDEVWPDLSRHPAEPAVLEGAFAPKLFEVRRLVEELVVEQNRKVVVFSQWRAMLRLAEWASREVLRAAGRRAVFFTGAESQAQRTKNVVDFHDEEDVSVMFLTDAGGVGLNLQRAASACINLELPWNPAVLEQRIGRIYRLGQKQPIDVYNLVTDEGIESRIAGLIASKRALFSGLFDGSSDEIRFESKGGFLSEVERLIEPVEVPDVGDRSGATDGGEDAGDTAEDAVGSLPAAAVGLSGGGDAPGVHARAEIVKSENLASAEAAGNGEEGVRAGPDAGAGAGRDTGAGAGPDAGAGAGRDAGAAVGSLFAKLRLARMQDGSLRLEAEPEAADQLIQLFEGMAALLRGSRG